MASLISITIAILSSSILLCVIISYFAKRNLKQALKELRHVLLSLMLFIPVIIYSITGLGLGIRTTHFSLALAAIILLSLLFYMVWRER